MRSHNRVTAAIVWLGTQLRRAELMVFVPALALAAFWLGGEHSMILVALVTPMMFALAGALRFHATPDPLIDGLTGLGLRQQTITTLDRALEAARRTGKSTACIVVQFDDIDTLLDRHGRAAQAEVLTRCAERLVTALRQGDSFARLEGGGFAITLAPQRRLDLEGMVQLATRLQGALTQPISLDATRIYISASLGFVLCQQLPDQDGAALLDAAQVAADEARRHGPGAIRAYAKDMARKRADRDALRDLLETALSEGQIKAHFQPQVSTDTGAISGFEALARWHHPDRGIVPPGDFLPAMEEAGLSEALGEVMLSQALAALVRWERAGFVVPSVGVNFCAAELRNPRLVERLQWELDRFDLTPDRLSVEILETVVARTDNDVIVRNIAALARLGCGIDLDDFGTGHASITNIRRFDVRRLKIDRSFVMHVDEDREQQKMVAAILSLAERLGLETLAEGVETAAEHAILAQLGCNHVQGFGIARPMPFEQTLDWLEQHRAQLPAMHRIGHRAR